MKNSKTSAQKKSATGTFQLCFLFCAAFVLLFFSKRARQGAASGLELAESTVIPSLLPILIIFLTVMRCKAKIACERLFGFFSRFLFNLPDAAFSAVLFGLLGGYPTGALLTRELYDNADIDREQAQRMMCFDFCGGAGFIITAVGTVTYKSAKIGLILFLSNIISASLVGTALSFCKKRLKKSAFPPSGHLPLGDALTKACEQACKSVLNITAYIVFFSAICEIIKPDEKIIPLIEITNGICKNQFSLPLVSAFASFGGLCIHLQIYPVLRRIKMKYSRFLLFRIICSAISFAFTKLILTLFPVEQTVFSNSSVSVEMTSVNATLSALLIIGCFVIVFDVRTKQKRL